MDAKNQMVDVSVEEYEAWLYGPITRALSRNVHTVCEPPLESINDFGDGAKWPDSMVACAMLMSEWPSLGIVDPRPADKRPHSWWRENCRIRADWLAKLRQGGGA
jgi:hypothetical protein